MKIFIAGATGVLGRGLIREFVAGGHQVAGLVRDRRGQSAVEVLGAQSRHADLFDADALARAAEGADVVIHAATAIPVKTRPTPRDWEMNDRIRRDGTRALAAAAARAGARLYIQQSIVWVARPPDGSFFDESSTPQPTGDYRSAYDGEQIAFEAGAREGFNVAALRCGWFYGADAAHTRMFGEGIMKRRLPIVGRGDAVWSCLHTEDAARAFVAAAEGDRTGVWHVVDNQPVTVEECLKAFAARLGAPAPRRVPVWLARLVAGRQAVGFFTSSTVTSNEKFRRDFGWTPRFASYREGFDQIADAWRAQGFLLK